MTIAVKRESRREDMLLLTFIFHHWPELRPFVPESLERVCYTQLAAYLEAHTTHPKIFKPDWGGQPLACSRFSDAPLPEGFFAMGVHSTDSERLFVMWVRGGRRFHFREFYFGAQGAESYAEVGERLRFSLAQWSGTFVPLVSTEAATALERDPEELKAPRIALAAKLGIEVVQALERAKKPPRPWTPGPGMTPLWEAPAMETAEAAGPTHVEGSRGGGRE